MRLLSNVRLGCLFTLLGLVGVGAARAAPPEPGGESKPAAPPVVAPPAPVAPAAGKSDPKVLAEVDELWKKRDDPDALAKMKVLVDRGVAQAPGDYEILWRATAWHFWVSDDPQRSRDEKIKAAKAGWDLGERAVAANPQGVEGQFFTTVSIGNYSIGIGILRALTQRIEGKFLTRLREAERLDPSYAKGSIWVTWGRYHATLPWPKYDAKKATAAFQHAIEVNPNNLRARVYWAELLLDEGQAAQAKRLLDEVAKAPATGRYDPPEERRTKLLGTMLLPKVVEALK